MSQFSVYKNKNPKTKSAYPYYVDVQSDLLDDLGTRIIIPLTKVTSVRKKPIRDLTPTVEVADSKYLVLTSDLASISTSELGSAIANVSKHRDEIVAALDFLITGV